MNLIILRGKLIVWTPHHMALCEYYFPLSFSRNERRQFRTMRPASIQFWRTPATREGFLLVLIIGLSCHSTFEHKQSVFRFLWGAIVSGTNTRCLSRRRDSIRRPTWSTVLSRDNRFELYSNNSNVCTRLPQLFYKNWGNGRPREGQEGTKMRKIPLHKKPVITFPQLPYPHFIFDVKLIEVCPSPALEVRAHLLLWLCMLWPR